MPHRNRFGFLLTLVAAMHSPAQAKTKTLDLQGAEGQRGSQLCWAASSVTAIRMLRTPQELNRNLSLVTQDQLAAYRMLVRQDGVLESEFGEPVDLAKLERLTSKLVDSMPDQLRDRRIEGCKEALGPCNEANPPILLDMHFDATDPGEALNWSNIVEQIDSGRPVVFGWNTADRALDREFGSHFSLVTGYRVRRNVREVRLWDPWPASASGRGGQHSRWISYCTYRNPQNVMGSEARHQFDRYNLTRIFADGPAQPRRSSPPSITPDGACPTSSGESPPAATAASSITAALDAFRDEPSIRETLKGRAIPRRALFKHFAPGLPIVSVTASRILESGGDADVLLVDKVNSVLVPVMRGRSTVDSFLVLRDGSRGWLPGGYANTPATALLVAERGRREAGDYYMVSVPSMNAFFLAQGTGAEASLIPIADHMALDVTAGEPRKASFIFNRVEQALRATP